MKNNWLVEGLKTIRFNGKDAIYSTLAVISGLFIAHLVLGFTIETIIIIAILFVVIFITLLIVIIYNSCNDTKDVVAECKGYSDGLRGNDVPDEYLNNPHYTKGYDDGVTDAIANASHKDDCVFNTFKNPSREAIRGYHDGFAGVVIKPDTKSDDYVNGYHKGVERRIRLTGNKHG